MANCSHEINGTMSAFPKIKPSAPASAKPFWSVMIPIYHPHSGYLEETLRSVLAQDPGPEQMQIEVVDDGSPNGSPVELIRKIAGDRITIYSEPRNLGLAGIWNRCIERARGEWVHILHQDDLVYPGFYEFLKHGIEAHPKVGAAYCRHAYCDENGHWHRLSILEMASSGALENFVEPLVTAERVQCVAMTVRRSTYERVGGFNPNLKHALDWEMWIRIANQFPIFYEPKILACWRNHADATTSRQIRSGENIRDIAKAIGIVRSYLPENEAERLADYALARFAKEAAGLAEHLLKQGDFEASLNQAQAAQVCQAVFRFRVLAGRIRLRATQKRIMDRLRRSWLKPVAKKILRRPAD